jgi:hypothetical protein
VGVGAELLHDQLAVASPHLLRDMLSEFIQAVVSAEADALPHPSRT